jgi:hypothetical protein
VADNLKLLSIQWLHMANHNWRSQHTGGLSGSRIYWYQASLCFFFFVFFFNISQWEVWSGFEQLLETVPEAGP